MDRYPLITVLTLSYNSTYIYESIQSVLEQSYPHIEYIIVDDGSGVFCQDEIRTYIKNRKGNNLEDYQVIVHPQNLGTVKASNTGLVHSHGEYIFNLAADDVFFDSDVLTKWTREMICRNSMIMTGRYAVYDEAMMECKGWGPCDEEVQVLESKSPEKIFRKLINANFIYGCCTARSRLLIESYGLYDENYRLIEDYPAALSLSRQGVVIDYWEQPVVKYRQGGVSSPWRFNSDYERDSDKILRREILPYVNFKFYIKLQYYFWKLKRSQDSRFAYEYSLICGEKQKVKVIFLMVRYPIPALRILKRKLSGKYKTTGR
ncbi:MAG: glycosyltransferase [Enterocloster citroniae]|uniref:glycosyltransferase n=1 Tax=Enterocloster aldenensis TaxID=358742 RepID=UPI0025A477BC|nr:glycosyltransferase [Enterocloster citroniae]MDM8295832.1 glycosyltransferase [Enterocloster aldenensis]